MSEEQFRRGDINESLPEPEKWETAGRSTGEVEPSEPKQAAAHKVYEWVEWIAEVAVCVVLLLTFGVRTVGVYGVSMLPTLEEGDRLFTTRLGGAPDQFDIVAITQPNSQNIPLIKRVIAVGGQTIDIDFDSGDVTVDGVVLDEPYIRERITWEGQYDLEFPMTVPEGCIFAMGDNRNQSWDSRASEVGMIDERYVLGTAFFRFAPFDKLGVL